MKTMRILDPTVAALLLLGGCGGSSDSSAVTLSAAKHLALRAEVSPP